MSCVMLYNYDLDENCYKVRLALSMIGVKYATVAVNAYPGKEHLSPPLLALNPAGALPILKDGELTMSGVEAVMAHLANAHDAGATWLPGSSTDFANVMQWLVFASGELSVAVAARAHALFGAPGDEKVLRRSARKALRIMDDHMTARGFEGIQWFATDKPTIADIALFPSFGLSRDFGVDHDEYPALRRWARRFREIPGFLTMPGIPDYH